ncbi:hypothetical protein EVAR_23536_1 [Eumeta japonica]|uniref:Uncharacterized protein n=1 Tax=Eumeta variegata TaxID=151549 RepID=A0A4C1WWB8_EUMVA|nr:hypothetical protein EVAR_23536_1 [Eumeta japonica]
MRRRPTSSKLKPDKKLSLMVFAASGPTRFKKFSFSPNYESVRERLTLRRFRNRDDRLSGSRPGKNAQVIPANDLAPPAAELRLLKVGA